MKAIVIATEEPVFVIPVMNDNGSVKCYVSDTNHYEPNELKLINNPE